MTPTTRRPASIQAFLDEAFGGSFTPGKLTTAERRVSEPVDFYHGYNSPEQMRQFAELCDKVTNALPFETPVSSWRETVRVCSELRNISREAATTIVLAHRIKMYLIGNRV